jgi:transposase
MAKWFLGIDIAKHTYQVTLMTSDGAGIQRCEFANEVGKFKKLTNWLKRLGIGNAADVHACMEATGLYGEALGDFLHQAGYAVSVVNPLRIKSYAKSKLARNKTDALDADLIADFCRTQTPEVWTPSAPEVRQLQALVRQYEALQSMRQQEVNRLDNGRGRADPNLKPMLHAHVKFMDKQLEQLDALISQHIDQHPSLKHDAELLDSIPGIGTITAAKLLSEDLRRFDDTRAVSAYAGVNPVIVQSGKSIHRRSRLSKLGSASLRKALYMPAISAKRWNPVVKAFCQNLADSGLNKMQVIGAAMRKLLCIAFGVLKSDKPFDPLHRLNRATTP